MLLPLPLSLRVLHSRGAYDGPHFPQLFVVCVHRALHVQNDVIVSLIRKTHLIMNMAQATYYGSTTHWMSMLDAQPGPPLLLHVLLFNNMFNSNYHPYLPLWSIQPEVSNMWLNEVCEQRHKRSRM